MGNEKALKSATNVPVSQSNPLHCFIINAVARSLNTCVSLQSEQGTFSYTKRVIIGGSCVMTW